MKKIIFTAFIAVYAMGASATISRLKALGMDEIDNEGSYYIKDSRNIFLNVANINNYANSVIYEWGGNGSKTVGGDLNARTTLSTDQDPKGQGGFLLQGGNFVYGAYLGNESTVSSMLRVLASSKASTDANFFVGTIQSLGTSDNQFDLFIGSETGNGLKWGANFLYAASKDEASKATTSDNFEEKGMAVRFGLIGKRWDAHMNFSVKNNSKNSVKGSLNHANYTAQSDFEHEFDGKLGLHVGGSYQLGHGRLFAFYKSLKWDQKDGADYAGYTVNAAFGVKGASGVSLNDAGVVGATGKKGTSEGSFNTILVGHGCQKTIGQSTFFSKLYLKQEAIEVNLNAKAEVNQLKIPLVVGFEHVATKWLTLRGSVTQVLYGTRKNNHYEELNFAGQLLAIDSFGGDTGGKKVSMTNTTDVRAGASLTFGNLNFDGFVGTTSASRVVTTSKDTKDGTFSLDNLMTRVGMTYTF